MDECHRSHGPPKSSHLIDFTTVPLTGMLRFISPVTELAFSRVVSGLLDPEHVPRRIAHRSIPGTPELVRRLG